jgi:autotransporter translocation and assembly factor TamB
MRLVRYGIAIVLLLALLLAGLAYFVAGTESGLQLVGQTLKSTSGDWLQIGRVSGRLAGAIDVEDLRIQVEDDVYRIGHLHLEWSPLALLFREFRVKRLTAEAVTVALAESAEDSRVSIDIELPVAITLAESTIQSLSIEGLTDDPLVFERFTLSARAAGQQLQIESLQLTAQGYHAGLAGTFGLQADNPADLQLDWQIQTGSDAPRSANGQATIRGLLHAYHLQGESSLSAQDISPVTGNSWRMAHWTV